MKSYKLTEKNIKDILYLETCLGITNISVNIVGDIALEIENFNNKLNNTLVAYIYNYDVDRIDLDEIELFRFYILPDNLWHLFCSSPESTLRSLTFTNFDSKLYLNNFLLAEYNDRDRNLEALLDINYTYEEFIDFNTALKDYENEYLASALSYTNVVRALNPVRMITLANFLDIDLEKNWDDLKFEVNDSGNCYRMSKKDNTDKIIYCSAGFNQYMKRGGY